MRRGHDTGQQRARQGQRAWIGFGSNLGDRRAAIVEALRCVDALPETRLEAVSSLYESEPMYVLDQPRFLNGCARLCTLHDGDWLLAQLQQIEQGAGRARVLDKGPRTLDLDILLIEDRVIDQAHLRVPHPGIEERAFVLVPMAEIDAQLAHPVSGHTIGQMTDALDAAQRDALRRVEGAASLRSTLGLEHVEKA